MPICPGFIETLCSLKQVSAAPSRHKAAFIDLHPMKRMGKSEEVANALFSSPVMTVHL